MPDNAVVLLDNFLADRARLRAVSIPEDEEFELFCCEQCLKDEDLSPDEIASGQVGGGNDGGIDGVYCFLDHNLIAEDAEHFEDDFDVASVKREVALDLVIVQAKRGTSFAETPFEKVSASLKELLSLSKADESLRELFSPVVVERFGLFRKTWEKMAPRHPQISVTFHYATKGDTGNVNTKVDARANLLVEQIESEVPGSQVKVRLLGARELVDLAGQEKSYTLQLRFQENATAEESHLALVSLQDYFDFTTDENGALRKYVFDWNVRDYAGKVEVNREIAASLADHEAPEFWWLNNGVTVICSAASSTGKRFSLDDVQIVNGLQTSMTMYDYLREATEDDPARERSILVRIIVTEDHATRDLVIRATNRQTNVPLASLRATDAIQRDLERYFLQNDWFYERRKNYYRNLGRSQAKIVSIPYLAQAIMAIGLSEPSNSRARPSSLLKRDSDYEKIFDKNNDYGIYLWAAMTQKQVDEFLRSDSASANASQRTNLRFHMSMLLAAKRLEKRVYSPSELGALVGTDFSEEEMKEVLSELREALDEFMDGSEGAIDKIVKGRDFTEFLFEKQASLVSARAVEIEAS